MSQLFVTEADLHAYVDGLLPLARRAEIDAYLALRPAEAQRLRAYTQQNQALRALFDPVLEEAVPAPLAAPASRRRWQLQRYAAALLIALAGGAGGWFAHGWELAGDGQVLAAAAIKARHGVRSDGLARQAAIAHVVYSPDLRRPVEIGAEQEEQLVTWLSKRLGTQVRPPRLGPLGYELIGGRLLPGTAGPVAQFMYHDAKGQRLTLYLSNEQAGNQDTGFRFTQEGQVNVFYWIDGKFGYALSATVTQGELARIAGAVYQQLQTRG